MTLRKRIVLAVSLLFLTLTTGCGKKVEVNIKDGEVVTTVEVRVPNTVEKILGEAEITIGEEDSVTPAMDEKLEDAGEITILRMHHVKVSVDGTVKETSMLGGTVKELLAQEGIKLADNMSMNVKEDDLLQDGMEIVIESSYGVTVVHDGKEESLTAGAGTVSDFLKKANISVDADDIVEPALDTPIKEGIAITVKRVEYKEEGPVAIEIPFNTIRQNDSSMTVGQEVVSVKGVKGKKNVTYKIKYIDGTEAEREVVKEEIVSKPTDAVVRVGTKPGRYVISRTKYPNCADGSHGYIEIRYSDGTVEYVEY